MCIGMTLTGGWKVSELFEVFGSLGGGLQRCSSQAKCTGQGEAWLAWLVLLLLLLHLWSSSTPHRLQAQPHRQLDLPVPPVCLR